MESQKQLKDETANFMINIDPNSQERATFGAASQSTADASQVEQHRGIFRSQKGEEIYAIIRYATLAANSHNTQPWKFAIHADQIEIHPDLTRTLPVVDHQNRSLWISLGCALENLVLAARAYGYETEISYPQNDTPYIRVRLLIDSPLRSPAFEAIPFRQNTRSEYNGKKVDSNTLQQLTSITVEPGIGLRLVVTPEEMETVSEYVTAGTLAQYSQRAFLNELISWLRFNEKEALSTRDGLYSKCSGNPSVPRWLGSWFVSRSRPVQQAESDVRKLRSSAGVVVITAAAEDVASWVRVGRVYQRLALTMTSLGIKSALLNQPIEVPEIRDQFQSALSLAEMRPQLLVRFGYADPMPKSLRRPVEQVLI